MPSQSASDHIWNAWQVIEEQLANNTLGARDFDQLALDLLNAYLAARGHSLATPAIITTRDSYQKIDARLPDGVDGLPAPAVAIFSRRGGSRPGALARRVRDYIEAGRSDSLNGLLLVLGQRLSSSSVDTLQASIVRAAGSTPVEIWDLEMLRTIALQYPEALAAPMVTPGRGTKLSTVNQAIETIEGSDPSDFLIINGGIVRLTLAYYDNVLSQARSSFRFALAASALGTLFFLGAVAVGYFTKSITVAVLSFLSGALIQVISGLNFYIYGESAKQFSSFHVRLDRLQRSVLANSFCEGLDEDTRGKARTDVIRRMMPIRMDVERSDNSGFSSGGPDST